MDLLTHDGKTDEATDKLGRQMAGLNYEGFFGIFNRFLQGAPFQSRIDTSRIMARRLEAMDAFG